MVFMIAASSLHHALETLNPEEKEQYKDKTHTIPGRHKVLIRTQKKTQKDCSKFTFERSERQKRRERLKSALYLRLKKALSF